MIAGVLLPASTRKLCDRRSVRNAQSRPWCWKMAVWLEDVAAVIDYAD
jgi:hypothetical protein